LGDLDGECHLVAFNRLFVVNRRVSKGL
jgi:hypothetical protein